MINGENIRQEMKKKEGITFLINYMIKTKVNKNSESEEGVLLDTDKDKEWRNSLFIKDNMMRLKGIKMERKNKIS